MPTGFDLFAPGFATVLVLVAARMGGLVLTAPVFSARTIPTAVRTLVVVLVSVLLAPVAMGSHTGTPALTPAAVLTETVIGMTIGLGAALIVGASEAAGAILGVQIGLEGAALLDPVSQSESSALGQFTNLFTITLLLSLNLHLVMLQAVASSFVRLPVGATLHLDAGLSALVGLGSRLFVMGVRFASPVIAAVMVANAMLAVLGRVAPQMNLLAISFPVQIAVGVFALGAALPFIAAWLHGWQFEYQHMLSTTFSALQGASGGGR
jgi:flagellar biosynthesis protein FliR